MDDPSLIREFVEGFQGVAFPEEQARHIAGVVRSANDLARAASDALPFEAEASGFLLALEAEESSDGR